MNARQQRTTDTHSRVSSTFVGHQYLHRTGAGSGIPSQLQRKATHPASFNPHHSEVPPIVHDAIRSPGQPLDVETRAFMEPRFGHDFSNVRIHTDAKAAESARAVNAFAYTVGSDVVFGKGHYAPETATGKRLIAHELTHVVQQTGMQPQAAQRASSEHSNEQEAEVAERRLETTVGGALQPISVSSFNGLQRLAGPEIVVSPEAIAEMHALLQEFTALSESGAIAAAEATEVTAVVAEAEAALAVATEVAAAGATAVTVGETALVASGALAADDVTGVGVADDIAIPFLLLGALVAFGVGYAVGSSANEIAAAGKKAAETVERAIKVMQKTVAKTKKRKETETQTQSQPEPRAEPQTQTTGKSKRPKPCRITEPCDHPLPIAWPTQLPAVVGPRDLRRVDKGDREWEGIERGDAQEAFAKELKLYRERNLPLPPGIACFEDEAEPNTPFHAHHMHPLYLNGEDATWNLCALERLRHLQGHARLDNQTPFLPVYLECGICSPFLSRHPKGQEYVIVAEK